MHLRYKRSGMRMSGGRVPGDQAKGRASLFEHDPHPRPPRSDPQSVRMCKGERPRGVAKGKQTSTMASCQSAPPPPSPFGKIALRAAVSPPVWLRSCRGLFRCPNLTMLWRIYLLARAASWLQLSGVCMCSCTTALRLGGPSGFRDWLCRQSTVGGCLQLTAAAVSSTAGRLVVVRPPVADSPPKSYFSPVAKDKQCPQLISKDPNHCVQPKVPTGTFT